MAKSEIGVITGVIKGAHPGYQVRLPAGETVVVLHEQIQPARQTLLIKGTNLRVTHELGKVSAASTDLALELSGTVESILPGSGAVYYKVEMDQGPARIVGRALVSPHPAHNLKAGARLLVRLDGNVVQSATLVSETMQGTIQQVHLAQGTLRLQDEFKETHTVRLKPDVLRSLQVGEILHITVNYTSQGERSLSLERPARKSPRPPAEADAPEADQRQPPRTASTQARPKPPASTEPIAQADTVGIDPVYMAQREKEHHRREIMAFIKRHAHDGLIEWYRVRPGKPASYASPAAALEGRVQSAIEKSIPGFKGYYEHQARALDAIHNGRSLVIVTQTASGKTLSYNPAVFEYLVEHPEGHALYVFPLNALMTDQKEKIDALRAALQSAKVNLTACDLRGGLAPEKRRAMALDPPNILATNPEMLSVIENEANHWNRFFSGLKFIILDEVHSYRGIFGVHMTGILRRLLLTARRAGARPQFILCSATISNPLDLAARLTSLPEDSFDLIDETFDSSQQADKHWLVLNPDWGTLSSRFHNDLDVAAETFVELIEGRSPATRLNAIVFCRSIRDVNRVYRSVTELLKRRAPELINKVRKYISAELSADAKVEIYEGLRSGRYLGVISTNALEAGIDIGHLDACIIAGFPFSVMTARQMAGRVGRQEEGLVIYIPSPLSSLDQYYHDHPDLLLTQAPEVFAVDPLNPYVARKYINAAANHLSGLAEKDLVDAWGMSGVDIARQAQREGVMTQRGTRWYGTRRDYRNSADVYNIQNIRSNAQDAFVLCRDGGAPCPGAPGCRDACSQDTKQRLGVLDRQYVYRDCHPGAIYEAVDGGLYRVTRLDEANKVAYLQEMDSGTLERTYVEQFTSIDVKPSIPPAGADATAVGHPRRGRRAIGVEMEAGWDEVTVSRFFTGYHRYFLQPARRCRRCRKEFNEDVFTCPTCGQPTVQFYTHSRPERCDFGGENSTGYRQELKTIAGWLAVPAEMETNLEEASPCKLPGERNRVQAWLKRPLNLDRLPQNLHVTSEEKELIADYHRSASSQLHAARAAIDETVLFPGVYGQCLLARLRKKLPEERCEELFEAVSGYPVTENLNHICRKCQSSALYPAMHTLEHAVLARYPSVALGDRSDLGSYTTLGHSATGKPTIFWYDNYEGGLGAAEKVIDQFERLAEAAAASLRDCTCTTLEGCPRCTFIGGCTEGNDGLNKPAALLLIGLLTGKPVDLPLRPYILRKKRAADFDKDYEKNEYASSPIYERETGSAPVPIDPFALLQVQQQLHELVLNKAYEVRSHEIGDELPPVSARDLNEAYRRVRAGQLLTEWRWTPQSTPYQVLELRPTASQRLIQQVYHLLALQVHPDANPQRQAWANEMMKLLNEAYANILREKKNNQGA